MAGARVTTNFGPARRAAQRGLTDGLEDAAADVLAASQKIVPYIKGELAASGDSGLVSDTRSAVTYRDRGAVGAHERLDIQPANGRQRKYLETALTSSRRETLQTIGKHVRRRLG
jgi:hypothetical protein